MGGKSPRTRPRETVRQRHANTREINSGGISPERTTMKISDLVPDRKNANRGTKRGSEAVERSLRDFGSGRSILIDSKGRIIAGNKTALNAIAAGLEDVVIVPSDGTKIIAVQRTDLDLETDLKAKALAVADNRTAELGLEWDPDNLADLTAELDLKPFFTDQELVKITALNALPEPGSKSGEVDVDSFEFAHSCPKCRFQFND